MGLDKPGRCFAVFARTFKTFVCFTALRSPSENESTLKGKTLLSVRAKSLIVK